jgi:hypothetical protein
MFRRGGLLRKSMMLVGAAAVVAALAVSPVGAITAHTATITKKKVKKISTKVATNVFNAKAPTLKDACAAGTVRYGGACFETSARGAADWQTASQTCGDAGRRLPTASELVGVRNVSGITLAGSGVTTAEMSSNIYRDADFGFIGVTDDGNVWSVQQVPFTSNVHQFRCVAPLTNS